MSHEGLGSRFPVLPVESSCESAPLSLNSVLLSVVGVVDLCECALPSRGETVPRKLLVTAGVPLSAEVCLTDTDIEEDTAGSRPDS